MELSLTEVARLLGKSERQVRYMVKTGKLAGRKVGGRWSVRREDVPLSEGQERAARQKGDRAARLAEEVLRPEGQSAKKGYSLLELRAFREGVPLYREIASALGDEHAIVELLREALMLLACGFHEFEGEAKARHYAGARQHASRAVAALLLDDEVRHRELVARLETTFLPALGGLIHQAEKRDRGTRGERRRR